MFESFGKKSFLVGKKSFRRVYRISHLFLLLATPYVMNIGAQDFCWPKIINQLGWKWGIFSHTDSFTLKFYYKKSSKRFWNIGRPIFSKLPPTLVPLCPIFLDPPTPPKIGHHLCMFPYIINKIESFLYFLKFLYQTTITLWIRATRVAPQSV